MDDEAGTSISTHTYTQTKQTPTTQTAPTEATSSAGGSVNQQDVSLSPATQSLFSRLNIFSRTLSSTNQETTSPVTLPMATETTVDVSGASQDREEGPANTSTTISTATAATTAAASTTTTISTGTPSTTPSFKATTSSGTETTTAAIPSTSTVAAAPTTTTTTITTATVKSTAATTTTTKNTQRSSWFSLSRFRGTTTAKPPNEGEQVVEVANAPNVAANCMTEDHDTGFPMEEVDANDGDRAPAVSASDMDACSEKASTDVSFTTSSNNTNQSPNLPLAKPADSADSSGSCIGVVSTDPANPESTGISTVSSSRLPNLFYQWKSLIDSIQNGVVAVSVEAAGFGWEKTNELLRALGSPVWGESCEDLKYHLDLFKSWDTSQSASQQDVIEQKAEFKNDLTCFKCKGAFSVSRYRWHCANCGESFCTLDLPHRDYIPSYGYSVAVRVCAECHIRIQHESYLRRVAFKLHRVQCFFDGSLKAIVEDPPEDSNYEKAKRGFVAAVVVAKKVPFPYYGMMIQTAAQATELIMRHGSLTLQGLFLSQEFSEAAATIKTLAGNTIDISMTDLVGGMYYRMCFQRFFRGSYPNFERNQFVACPSVPSPQVREILRVCPLAVSLPYLESEEDLQRLLGYQGYQLLFAETVSSKERPAYYLAADSKSKTVLLGVRGTNSLHDVLTDLAAVPVKWPPEDYHEATKPPKRADEIPSSESFSSLEGTKEVLPTDKGQYVHAGMGRAAMWLFKEVIFCLQSFSEKGYKVLTTGHSLAAGVVTLLSILLRPYIPELQCFAYATPACMGELLGDSCRDYVTSVVLAHDVVPRASVAATRKLVQDLDQFKPIWNKMWEEDKAHTSDRLKGIWTPRLRHTGTFKRNLVTENERVQLDQIFQIFRQPLSSMISVCPASPTGSGPTASLSCTGEQITSDQRETNPSSYSFGSDENFSSDSSTCADDDHAPNLLSERGDENDVGRLSLDTDSAGASSEHVKIRTGQIEPDGKTRIPVTMCDVSLAIPGTIVHIFFHRGLPEAIYIAANHPSLNRIELSQNMFEDHKSERYIRCLQTILRSRKSLAKPLNWDPFSFDGLCACCQHDFTWASTSHSLAQQALDRHNCSRCGRVVCTSCSSHSTPLPVYGISSPVRVCDACYYNVADIDNTDWSRDEGRRSQGDDETSDFPMASDRESTSFAKNLCRDVHLSERCDADIEPYCESSAVSSTPSRCSASFKRKSSDGLPDSPRPSKHAC